MMKTEIIGDLLFVTFYAGSTLCFRIKDNRIFIRSTRTNVKDEVTVSLYGDYLDRIIQALNYLDLIE